MVRHLQTLHCASGPPSCFSRSVVIFSFTRALTAVFEAGGAPPGRDPSRSSASAMEAASATANSVLVQTAKHGRHYIRQMPLTYTKVIECKNVVVSLEGSLRHLALPSHHLGVYRTRYSTLERHWNNCLPLYLTASLLCFVRDFRAGVTTDASGENHACSEAVYSMLNK